jgi:hypothetical protein
MTLPHEARYFPDKLSWWKSGNTAAVAQTKEIGDGFNTLSTSDTALVYSFSDFEQYCTAHFQ